MIQFDKIEPLITNNMSEEGRETDILISCQLIASHHNVRQGHTQKF